MKIAYISYEFPPDTAFGGIATYIFQVSKIMHDRGHNIEVFCASNIRTCQENQNGILVNKVMCLERKDFSKKILPVFSERYQDKHFDLMEAAEFSADGLEIKKAFPQIPLVVKLHTPWYLLLEINHYYFRWYHKLNYLVRGLVQGQIRKRFWIYDDIASDPDFQITSIADQIQSPSISLGDIISTKWKIERVNIVVVPNPFTPKTDMLAIPVISNFKVASFIGRLELRKGVVELVKALPYIFENIPDFVMRFIGKPENSPVKNVNMKDYITRKLRKYASRIEFKQYDSSEIHLAYSATDICVFPSLWENFPNVCLEAMSAGRAVVASKFGGMSDMIVDGQSGMLIDPFNTRELADSIIYLLNNREVRSKLGENARTEVLKKYNKSVIGELMEKNYQLAAANSVTNIN